MGGIFGGGKGVNTTAERLTGVQLSTSAYGGPVAIVIGTQRVPANLIDYDNFKAIPHTTKSGGGGSGGAPSSSNTTYTYTAAVILALCEGPAALGKVWVDKAVTTIAKLGFTVHDGARGQAPDSWWTTNHATKALGYGGTCYVCHPNRALNDSGGMKNYSFEVAGLLTPASGDPAFPDAHPYQIIPLLLSDPYVSVGWNAARIGDLSTGAASYRAYCLACGLFLSPLINEQKTAAECIKEILEATNSEPVWTSSASGMTLKIVPYGDQAVTGNSTTFTPNVTPLYDLTVDDFMPEDGADPIEVEITSQADSFNNIPIEFLDRSIDYDTNVVSDPDQNDIDTYQERKASSVALHCITRASVATQISGIKARRSVNCRNHYKFRLGWRYILLEPMDLVTISDPLLGLDHKVVRIQTIEEDGDGYLSFVAEEWPFGVATATRFAAQTSDGLAQDAEADPGNAYGPVAWEAPALYSGGARQLILSASGGALWGGCDVWISEDNATYNLAGSITNPGRHGHLTATLPAGSALDTANVLRVQLDDTRGQLASVSDAYRDQLQTLAWVDGELLAYKTAALTGSGAYDLSSLRRGAYGTIISSHASAAKFARIDDSTLTLDLPAARSGPLYIKLQSYNCLGGGIQDISALPVFAYTLAGTISLESAAITGLTAVLRSGRMWLVWDALPIYGIQYEIRKGATWGTAQILGTISPNELQAQGAGTYWVAARLDNAVGATSYLDILGVPISDNVVVAVDEAPLWDGTFTGGCTTSSAEDIRLTGSTLFGSLSGMFTALPGMFEELSGLSPWGEYESAHEVDLGIAQVATLSEAYGFAAAYPATSFVKTYMQMAGDDDVYGAWIPFVPGQYFARKFKRKIRLECDPTIPASSPKVTAWSWVVDMADRFEVLTAVQTPDSGNYTWQYSRNFMAAPNVQITLLDGLPDDKLIIESSTETQCAFRIENASAVVVRTFNALSQGY